MRWLWVGTRTAAVLAVVIAIIATYITAEQPVNLFNFFGFFTIQANVLTAIALAWAAIGLARGRVVAPLLRGAMTVYIGVTGLVYNTLLTDVAGGVALPWANSVLHVVIPIYAVLDWIVVADRPALPWSRIWVVVPYPLVWLGVVLVRGATDGWVPYPFLNPRIGYPLIAAYCLGITVAVLVFAAAVWAISRLHLPTAPVAADPDRRAVRAAAA